MSFRKYETYKESGVEWLGEVPKHWEMRRLKFCVQLTDQKIEANREKPLPLRENIDEYFEREILPHVPEAWIDKGKTKVGYEIPFNRYFYTFKPPRELDAIDADLIGVTDGIVEMIEGVTDGIVETVGGILNG